jgi:hypothetical protein
MRALRFALVFFFLTFLFLTLAPAQTVVTVARLL